jgi:uncharacterized protein (TIGR02246 family)
MRLLRTRTLALAAIAAALSLLAASQLVQLPRSANASAQERSDKSTGKANDEQAIRKAGAAYLEAMNKGDLNALLAHWAPDADYIDESGKTTRGKDALTALFKKGLNENKGRRVTGRVNSLKILRPEVAMEDGSLEFTAPDGSKESNRYAVVWVKSGDQWLINSVRDLPAETGDLPSLAYAQLKALEWLVGEWQDASGKIDVHTVCRWDRNKSFLVMEYEVKHQGAEPIQVSQRIGWDGHNGMVRSWVFDSQGGFGEGYWQRQGNRWVVSKAGVLPDGGTGGATNVYEFVDQDQFIWRALDRDVDGHPLADAEIKFIRKTSK